jgi:hypothetical protein
MRLHALALACSLACSTHQLEVTAALTAACEEKLLAAAVGDCVKDCATPVQCNAISVDGTTPPAPPPPPIGDNEPCMPAKLSCASPGFGDQDACNGIRGCLWDAELEPLVAKCTGSTEAGCDALPGCEWELNEGGRGDCAVPPPPAPVPELEDAPRANFTACEGTKGCVRREATDEVVAGCQAPPITTDAQWYDECYTCSATCQTLVDDA